MLGDKPYPKIHDSRHAIALTLAVVLALASALVLGSVIWTAILLDRQWTTSRVVAGKMSETLREFPHLIEKDMTCSCGPRGSCKCCSCRKGTP